MPASEEQQVIKQYQPLIRALIPYEQDNRLLEGLNKFTGRVSASIRKTIKEEVIRLTSLTDAPADNSSFAQFPVFKFSHFGVEMRLDKVGARILQKESELYRERYTVGVFESITNSDFYKDHLKKENHKKIVDAFTIESQTLDDINFGDALAITPHFPVSSLEFEKGRSCTVSSFASNSMSLESKRPPKVSSKEVFSFHLPEVPGIPKEQAVRYMVSAIKFNKHTEKYETHFRLHPSTEPKILAALKKYVNMASFQQPLQRELESERAMQDLERDRILDNSPWVPVFLQVNKQGVTPLSVLFTAANDQFSGGISATHDLTRPKLITRIMAEMARYSESFVITGLIQTKQGEVRIAATIRELESAGIIAQVIHLLNANKSMYCAHCRLQAVGNMDKQKAFAIHDIVSNENEQLMQISQIMYYRNATESLSGLALSQRLPMPAIPEEFLQDTTKVKMSLLFDEQLNRRAETRYLLEKEGAIKTGLLKSQAILVRDISPNGMCIELPEPLLSAEKELKVSVPEFKLKSQRYRVVGVSPCKKIIRLRLPAKRDTVSAGINQLVNKNISYFKSRDLAVIQRKNHRFAWELAVRHHPSASILCINNRYLINRLKTLYQASECSDLYPFSVIENVVPMHGFFADKNADKPKSRLLSEMFEGKVTSANVVHCVRKTDSKLVYLPEQEYFFGALRKQVHNHLTENKIELCVTKVDVTRCQNHETAMSKKRLAQLSRIDKPMYDRFSVMQTSYSHVLYLTSESALHSAVLRAKLRPVKAKAEQKQAAATA